MPRTVDKDAPKDPGLGFRGLGFRVVVYVDFGPTFLLGRSSESLFRQVWFRVHGVGEWKTVCCSAPTPAPYGGPWAQPFIEFRV